MPTGTGTGDEAAAAHPAPVLSSTKAAQTAGEPRAPAAALAKTETPGPVQAPVLERLADIIDARHGGDPQRSYVARLLALGPDAVLKKIGEEATETVMAAKDADPARIVAETADLWFHCLVMLSHFGLRPEQVLEELERRAGTSGLEEKALRKALARERDRVPPNDNHEG